MSLHRLPVVLRFEPERLNHGLHEQFYINAHVNAYLDTFCELACGYVSQDNLQDRVHFLSRLLYALSHIRLRLVRLAPRFVSCCALS